MGNAFAFGFSLLVTAWAFFRISGAHFNPAITLSSVITGHISVNKAVLFVISQLLGAMLGVALVRGTTPSSERTGQVNQLASLSKIRVLHLKCLKANGELTFFYLFFC